MVITSSSSSFSSSSFYLVGNYSLTVHKIDIKCTLHKHILYLFRWKDCLGNSNACIFGLIQMRCFGETSKQKRIIELMTWKEQESFIQYTQYISKTLQFALFTTVSFIFHCIHPLSGWKSFFVQQAQVHSGQSLNIPFKNPPEIWIKNLFSGNQWFFFYYIPLRWTKINEYKQYYCWTIAGVYFFI